MDASTIVFDFEGLSPTGNEFFGWVAFEADKTTSLFGLHTNRARLQYDSAFDLSLS